MCRTHRSLIFNVAGAAAAGAIIFSFFHKNNKYLLDIYKVMHVSLLSEDKIIDMHVKKV